MSVKSLKSDTSIDRTVPRPGKVGSARPNNQLAINIQLKNQRAEPLVGGKQVIPAKSVKAGTVKKVITIPDGKLVHQKINNSTEKKLVDIKNIVSRSQSKKVQGKPIKSIRLSSAIAPKEPVDPRLSVETKKLKISVSRLSDKAKVKVFKDSDDQDRRQQLIKQILEKQKATVLAQKRAENLSDHSMNENLNQSNSRCLSEHVESPKNDSKLISTGKVRQQPLATG